MATTRGTTPTHIFNIDTDLTHADVIYVTYKQRRDVVLEKSKEDVTVDSDKLEVRLTQAETLEFKSGTPVRVQIRARFNDGSAIASNIIETTAEEILKEGEI